MEWQELYPQTHIPSQADIEQVLGESLPLWREVTGYFETAHRAKPKLAYSVCSGKPGWNVKYQKSGQAFGTLYPEHGGFSVFFVIAYRLDGAMRAALPQMSRTMAEMYENAPDFMKIGRWMMFPMTEELARDYMKIVDLKMANR